MNTDSTPLTPCPQPPADARRDFLTTRWTQVSRAKADSPEGRRALAELCDAYYEPVAEFLRYELRDAEAARDLAHDFFASTLNGGAIVHAQQERGRFRSYLLGAVKHFLSHHREAARRLKRGGGAESFSLNDTDAGEARSIPDGGVLSPDAAFDRQWAVTVLNRGLDALRSECMADGLAAFFERVKPLLTGDSVHGEQAGLAAACGMNLVAFRMAVHRMKKRLRECVKAEVAGTLDDPAMVQEEMLTLFAALGG